MNGLRHRPFARSVLAGDEHVRFRRPDALNQLQHRPHRRRLGDEEGTGVRFERSILRFEPLLAAQRAGELDLRAEDGQKPRVFPRLLDEVASAATHRFDGNLYAAPRGHDHDRKGRIV